MGCFDTELMVDVDKRVLFFFEKILVTLLRLGTKIAMLAPNAEHKKNS